MLIKFLSVSEKVTRVVGQQSGVSQSNRPLQIFTRRTKPGSVWTSTNFSCRQTLNTLSVCWRCPVLISPGASRGRGTNNICYRLLCTCNVCSWDIRNYASCFPRFATHWVHTWGWGLSTSTSSEPCSSDLLGPDKIKGFLDIEMVGFSIVELTCVGSYQRK